MSLFVSRAEDILEIATSGKSGIGDTVVVLDRQGGMRMMPPGGWSLQAMVAEFGAEAVYRVERRGSRVRVEGWNGSERCLLQGEAKGQRLSSVLGLSIAAPPLVPRLCA